MPELPGSLPLLKVSVRPPTSGVMTPLRCLASVLLALLVLAPAAAHAASPSLLFVQQASSGTLERTGKGTYRLTLRGVAPSVASFTDRPSRTAASETTGAFVSKWARRGFAKDAPNAALVLAGAPKNRDLAMLTLRRPRYDAKARTLTYVARPLRGDPGAGLKDLIARRDPIRELRFRAASLFIDDAGGTKYLPLTLQVTDAEPGQTIAVQVSGQAPQSIAWSTGPVLSDLAGVQLISQTGSVPVTQLSISGAQLTIRTSAAGASGGTVTFSVRLYLAAPTYLDLFNLSSTSDPGILVTAAVGNDAPQVVNQTNTLFSWSPM